MTVTEPSVNIQDQLLNKPNTAPSFQVHLIEVSPNDLDAEIVRSQGSLCSPACV